MSTLTLAAGARWTVAEPDVTAQTVLTVFDLVWPEQSNHHGTLFGGAALAMLDRLAFIMGSRALRGTVVTAAVSRLDFRTPIPTGQLVECRARVGRRGVRSALIHTRLVTEDALSGERNVCIVGDFTVVRRADSEEAEVEAAPVAGSGSADLAEADEAGASAAVRVAEIVFPGHANHRGILHGGAAMEWIAKAGFIAASRHLRRSVVLASSERLRFVAPAHVGDVVEVEARVCGVGRRSVRVMARMWAEHPATGQRRFCTSANLVYVAIDD
ncbi:MAG: acyl-CoA thioesterase [Tepidimonas taiwanensis]|nr:acyl-CoA thioesterase [Tepidimonas taiwanensis]